MSEFRLVRVCDRKTRKRLEHLVAVVERRIDPLTRLFGIIPTPVDEFFRDTKLVMNEYQRVNLFGYRMLLRAHNHKRFLAIAAREHATIQARAV